MSLLRSPTNTQTGGGSQPDLSKISNVAEDSLITFRKRKRECDCGQETKEIRAELKSMTSLLEKFIDSNASIMSQMQVSIADVKTQITEIKVTNEQTISLIRENLAEVKTQITDIKSSSHIMSLEQTNIKVHVNQLEKEIAKGQNKIQSLESELNSFKLTAPLPSNSQTVTQPRMDEKLIREVQDRNARERNIIIVGVPEQTSSNAEERTCKDEADVMNITNLLIKDIPKPIKVIRIGKYTAGKIRRIKACYEAPMLAKHLLRNSYQTLQISKSRLNFLYLNARSIRKKGKLDELKCILHSIPTTTHVILVTETWIRSETQALELTLPNYTHYYNYRTDKKGGGVSAFIHNNLKHSLSESIYLDGNNYLWIRLEKLALEVGVVYYPGDTSYRTFLEAYESQLQQRSRAIIFGDFNIDLLKKEKEVKQYKLLVDGAGFTILNKISKKYCTRHSTTRKSIIDHVSSNLKNNNYHMAIINSSMSDHKQIYLELKKFKPTPIIRTKYEAIDYQMLYTSLEKADSDELSNDFTLLENKIKYYTMNSKTTKTKILNQPQKDWINKDLLSEINQRNYLWTELKQNPEDDSLEEKFKTKRNYTAKLIQNTKDAYYYKEFTKFSNKPKSMWKLINNLANNKIKQSCAPSKLTIDSKLITDINDDLYWQNKYPRIFMTISLLPYHTPLLG
ncbi:putative tick transposon [Operophtera brumata]|uniref:Putative tick transposon n=2 Tax=Operophtera brumata TaxID=104452 RepID=A0A0L7LUD6_OPEBR|nr:putative tick transposon [Operophtera brumata]